MKVKTNTLIGPTLDWAVAKCEGTLDRWVTFRPGVSASEAKLHKGEVWGLTLGSAKFYQKFQPSTDHAQGGPIIEREQLTINYYGFANPPYWSAQSLHLHYPKQFGCVGPTPLIAAMRCYVASKLGDKVDVPKELL